MSNDKEEFIQDLYDQAEEELKDIYKKKKEDRDKLLQQIAMIMLTYTILNGFMSLSKNEKDKEISKLSNDIKKSSKGQIEIQTSIIGETLKSTIEQTYDYYSYNYRLKDVRNIINMNFKGKHFSDRVWENEQATAKDLNKLLNQFLDGKIGVNNIQDSIKRTYNSSAYEAKRLAETELNRCESEAFERFCRETGVKKLRYNATLDRRVCDDCGQYHDKVFNLNEKIEVPRHPLCRCFYEIDDYVNQMTENEKKSKKSSNNSINWDVVNSKEYREKFKTITESEEVNNLLYQKAKDMLKHRNNTDYEDFHLIDTVEKKVVGSQTHSRKKYVVNYNEEINRALKKHPDNTLISMHNHPGSTPPSGGDFDSVQHNKYKKGIIICHNGDVYTYNTGKKPFEGKLFDLYVDKYKKLPYNLEEKDAYMKTLNEFKQKYNIRFEVL